MPIELKVPTVGESITEVMIGEWLKKEGEYAAEDEPVVVIETDKVNVELPAPISGVISKIVIGDGEDAEVGDVIGFMEEAEAPADAGKAKEAGKAEDAEDDTDSSADKSSADKPSADKSSADKKGDSGQEKRVMPAAARALSESGLSADQVEASGPGGRLLKEDVQRHTSKPSSDPKSTESKSTTETAEPAAEGARTEKVVSMTPLRRRVAARLVESQQNAALLTTFNEVDMSQVIALRKQYQERFVDRHGIKLGFMSFFIKAAVEALKEVPVVNARIDDQNVIYHNYFDIGVAVGGGKGLVVPVIRNAERLSFAGVEQTIAELAGRAKSGKLKLEELQGGTFTISNGGIYGSLLSTPIVNPPQSGILGLHKIEERPVAVDGQVVVRPMMYLALSYDHRIIDGREAVTFLVKIKERIEDPSRILLEI